MSIEPWWIVIGVGAIVAVMLFVGRSMRTASREARFAEARRNFHRQRERLEMKFVLLASARQRSNAPQWADCCFDDDVAYVRNRNTGELSAFVAITVEMGSADVPHSGPSGYLDNLRSGTAIFRFDSSHWETDGRAILNLSPAEAIRFYRNDLEMIDQELAGQP